MEVDEIQCKYTRISTTNGKLGHSRKMDDQYPDDDEEGENKRILPNGAGIARFYGWPSSRIVRVSRASGGKDRHSKVLTSKGLRDRRVRLSVNTAVQFYDLQDRLGYDQPSKAVEWLLKKAETSIAELPPMNTPFPETPKQVCDDKRSSTTGSDQLGFDSAEPDLDGGDPNYSHQLTKSSACSSTSETSKGSGLSLSRSESRIKARERAKERVAEKDKERENESSGHVASLNPISQTTSFTELLSGGINTTTSPPTNESNFFLKSPRQWSTTPMDYFAPVTLAPPSTRSANPFTPPLFTAEHHHPELQQLSFAPELTGNSSGEYNLNFSISPCANSSGHLVGFNRGTLQSNSSSSLLPHIQRFSDGSAPSFFIGATTTAPDHQFLSGYDSRLQLCYGDPHARLSGHKGKGKN